MAIHDYIAEKRAQLDKWESALEQRTNLTEKLGPWRAKRDEMLKKLETLASETEDRWDIVRMGLESAWAELQATYDAVTSKESSKHAS